MLKLAVRIVVVKASLNYRQLRLDVSKKTQPKENSLTSEPGEGVALPSLAISSPHPYKVPSNLTQLRGWRCMEQGLDQDLQIFLPTSTRP